MHSDPSNSSPSKKAKSPILWIALAIPYLALCFPQLYARATPVLFGFPFFYWYQFAWVVLTSILLGLVYRALKD